jgi:ABC-2 type transport system ATP-binding protein
MSEADELSSQIAIINKGKIIVSGTPSEIKKRFSKIIVLEVCLHQVQLNAAEKLLQIEGIEHLTSAIDGPLQKLTLQVHPGIDVISNVKTVIGDDNIDYISRRDPTLEEAYLSIIK